MLVFSSRPDQITRQLRDRLKTTGVGLGLLRLQLYAGMTRKPEQLSPRCKTTYSYYSTALKKKLISRPRSPMLG